MLPQTFNLVDQNWQLREARRRRGTILTLPVLAAAVVGSLLWAETNTPSIIPLFLGFWGVSGALFIAALFVENQGDPKTMAISGLSMTFTRRNGSHFSIQLDRERVSVTLVDQSAEPGTLSGVLGRPSPYLGAFGRATGWTVLTAEAFVALRSELPRAGLNLVRTGRMPFQSRSTRWFYRKG
jgi:hypothetical protein